MIPNTDRALSSWRLTPVNFQGAFTRGERGGPTGLATVVGLRWRTVSKAEASSEAYSPLKCVAHELIGGCADCRDRLHHVAIEEAERIRVPWINPHTNYSSGSDAAR